MTSAKHFVIIGGSSGIGLAISRNLAEKGHQVIVGSRTAGALEEVPAVTHVPFDATADPFPPEALPDAVDGLVYCPGTIRLLPFARLSEDDFTEDLRVNLLGAVRTIQACLPKLKKAPDGAAIVLFSTVAVRTGMPFHASVASAKGAVEGLTRSLAAELAPRIRVNAIAPSLTDTPLAARLLSSEDKRRASADRHPLKRIGDPKETAATAVFLLEPASAWITGQVLPVDGGMGSLRTFR